MANRRFVSWKVFFFRHFKNFEHAVIDPSGLFEDEVVGRGAVGEPVDPDRRPRGVGLLQRGREVVDVPPDQVIGGCAQGRDRQGGRECKGIELRHGQGG